MRKNLSQNGTFYYLILVLHKYEERYLTADPSGSDDADLAPKLGSLAGVLATSNERGAEMAYELLGSQTKVLQ